MITQSLAKRCRKEILTLLVSAVVSASFIILMYLPYSERIAAQKEVAEQIKELAKQSRSILDDIEMFDSYMADLTSPDATLFYTKEDRVGWRDSINQIKGVNSRASYSMTSQKKIQTVGKLSLFKTAVKFSAELRSDLDPALIIDALADKYVISVKSCSVTSLEKMSVELANIEMDCLLDWYTVNEH